MQHAVFGAVDAISKFAMRSGVVILAVDGIGDGKTFVVRYDGIGGRGAALFYDMKFLGAGPCADYGCGGLWFEC